jgi:hypothetical protein
MPIPLPHYTIADIAKRLGTADLGGKVGVDVKVDVAPSEDFVSKFVTGVANLLGYGSNPGTGGSTGLSMPEAVPNP